MANKKPLTLKQVTSLGGKAHGPEHRQKMLLARWHPEEYFKKYGVYPKKAKK